MVEILCKNFPGSGITILISTRIDTFASETSHLQQNFMIICQQLFKLSANLIKLPDLSVVKIPVFAS